MVTLEQWRTIILKDHATMKYLAVRTDAHNAHVHDARAHNHVTILLTIWNFHREYLFARSKYSILNWDCATELAVLKSESVTDSIRIFIKLANAHTFNWAILDKDTYFTHNKRYPFTYYVLHLPQILRTYDVCLFFIFVPTLIWEGTDNDNDLINAS